MTGADDGGLACGRRWTDLLDQVADRGQQPVDDHQEQCPHCQAALAEFAALWQPVHEVASEDVRAPADLVHGVMRRLRDVVPDDWYAAIAATGGTTKVAVRVLAKIATQAARRVPGVVVALGRRTDPEQAAQVERDTYEHAAPGSALGVAGGSVAVDLALVVHYGKDVRGIAREVRRAVRQDTESLTGLRRVEVNVVVDDVVVPADLVLPGEVAAG